uniref:DUF3768 domain-containing protein n=1 Tax=Pararhizobium sp. IMCC3301 TaxID=3067904 RepID=UPI0027405802|nr:DUF3768 domain-containing protein [Pararhizobium sp. IMCC3301]
MASSSETIRDLNDRFRQGDSTIPGRVMITIGVQNLIAEHDGCSLEQVIEQVQQFDTFAADNDPQAEHDFGAFDFLGAKHFWKIDYYAPDLQHGSEDPADISKTTRVLTLMLAEEY